MVVMNALIISSCSSADKKTALRVIVNMDIFEPAMHNLFDAGSIVIDSILDGTIGE
jgi:hypothetical protein